MAHLPFQPLSYLNDGSLKQPRFKKITLADQQDDGYWITAVDINGDGKLDIVTSGLAEGNICWYENPTWKRHPIAKLPLPVAIEPGDIAGRGRSDLVITHDYGNCMFWCRPQDGRISWLENPGSFTDEAPWNLHPICDMMAAHRIKLGHFTQTDRLELLGLPVVGCRPFGLGVHEPIAIKLLRKPEDVLHATKWEDEVIDDQSFRVIHDVVCHHFGDPSDPLLDSALLASEEGISWYYYDKSISNWKIVPIGAGDHSNAMVALKSCGQIGQGLKLPGFIGSGNVAYGRVGEDKYAYIAAIEPFHGNVVAVYTRKPGHGLTDYPWKRTVLDTFGIFDASSQGPGHHVVCGDFDGDGDDEFLVALRGPLPHQGVYYYKAIDVENALFERWRVSTASAARIAIGDFNNDGRLDFATTGYYTPGYYLCDNSQVNIFLNEID